MLDTKKSSEINKSWLGPTKSLLSGERDKICTGRTIIQDRMDKGCKNGANKEQVGAQ